MPQRIAMDTLTILQPLLDALKWLLAMLPVGLLKSS